MTRRIPLILTFSLLIVALLASSVFSARKKPARTTYNPIVRAIYDMALPMEHMSQANLIPTEQAKSLAEASLGASGVSASPGQPMGNSYYDYQANTYQGRMIRIGRHEDAGDSITLVHSVWMDLIGPSLDNGRGPAYAFYDAFAGVYQLEVNVTFSPEFAGYHNLEVTPGNEAIICGHYHPTGNTDAYSPTLWYDLEGPGAQGFAGVAIVPDTIMHFGNPYVGDAARTIWPHVAFQERPTGEHVTHVTALATSSGLSEHTLHYYRKEGNDSLHLGGISSCASLGDPDWDCPWVVDTVQATVGGVEASDKSGKVALFFTNNLPDYDATPGCDTCSVNASIGVLLDRYQNDVYYHVSDDYGVTWGNMVNVTQNDVNTMDWSPWNDIDGLWTGDARAEEFHIAWSASDWKAYREEGVLYFRSRVYHWKESFGTGMDKPRAAMTSRQDPIQCNAGAFNANLSKINLAECNGNIYITAVDLWDGHDDPANPDCSERGYGGDFTGSVNGDIVVVISDDGGLSFDLPHPLTESYTPECDPTGAILECDADHWPSMTPYGWPTRADESWGNVEDVNPRPAQVYNDGVGVEWLHIQYVNDKDPGFVINDNSTWQNNPIRHFRMACVDPDQIPVINLSITEINWPTFVPAGNSKVIDVIVENTGNSPLNFTVSDEEDGGPAGWLSQAGWNSPVTNGIGNLDTGQFTLDATGLSNGNVVYGRVIFDSDAPSDMDTIPVVMIVADTIVGKVWDTINTGLISLAVSNTGQYSGGTDIAASGGAKLDWFNSGDCDTVDSILGNTETYLYDGGFAVGGIVDTGGGLDTVFANQIFSQGFRNEWSVYPIGAPVGLATSGFLQTYNSGKMVNSDSTLQFFVRWYAPQATGSVGAGGNTRYYDQRFVTRCLEIRPNDGQSHLGLAIGDALDWDVPADSGSDNSGEADASRNLLYTVGGEYDDDPNECQDNSERYGGVAFAFMEHYKDIDPGPLTTRQWTLADDLGYGGYIEANARYVYPGWNADELYVNMEANNAYTGWVGPTPDSAQTDLHTVLTCAFDFDLLAGDIVRVYTVYGTVLSAADASEIQDIADKGRNFAKYFGCCVGTRGDLDGNGAEANILDLNYAVNRVFRGGPTTPCVGEGDANSDRSPLNILDLNFLVNRVFRGGAAPDICGS